MQERAAGIEVTQMCHFSTVQIQNARNKLQGKHPSEILLAELAPKHSSTKHWAALQVVFWLAALPIAWRLCKCWQRFSEGAAARCNQRHQHVCI